MKVRRNFVLLSTTISIAFGLYVLGTWKNDSKKITPSPSTPHEAIAMVGVKSEIGTKPTKTSTEGSPAQPSSQTFDIQMLNALEERFSDVDCLESDKEALDNIVLKYGDTGRAFKILTLIKKNESNMTIADFDESWKSAKILLSSDSDLAWKVVESVSTQTEYDRSNLVRAEAFELSVLFQEVDAAAKQKVELAALNELKKKSTLSDELSDDDRQLVYSTLGILLKKPEIGSAPLITGAAGSYISSLVKKDPLLANIQHLVLKAE